MGWLAKASRNDRQFRLQRQCVAFAWGGGRFGCTLGRIVTRWALLTFVTVMGLGAATVVAARFFGRSESRASVLVSVIAHWLAAYVLWTFAAGLAHRYGVLAAYDSYLFVVLAVAVGFWHYRVRLARGREPGLVVFVAGQLAWLVILLVQNGAFKP
jgi:hypothetical protein